MTNFLKEYLVRLGFQTDAQAFGKMSGILAAADRAVDLHAGNMARRLIEAQGAILGTFTSISAAIVGVMDKVAMADQGYRLFGMRMLMTTESARKLDMITKALGADLSTIVWDPEHHARAGMMAQDIDRMTKALGPEFAGRMKGIRDIRYEFSRLEVATKFLGMSFASRLFEKLAPGEAGDKLKRWVDWIEDHIPQIADKIATYAVPALRGTWEILQAAGEAAGGFAVAFTNLVGLLSGDTSIEGAAFSFDKLAKAIGHVGDWMIRFFKWITTAETMLADFFSSLSLGISGKFEEAGKAFLSSGSKFAKIISSVAGGAATGAVIGSVVPGVGTLTGAAVGGAASLISKGIAGVIAPESAEEEKPSGETRERSFLERFPAPPVGARPTTPELASAAAPARAQEGTLARADLVAAIQATADKYGVSRSLALAVAQQESGINQDRRSKAGAIGVMQLMPDTAKGLRVNPHDAIQNIDGGVRYLRDMLARYHGDTAKALAAYNAGPGKADHAASLEDLPRETRAYVPSVLRIEAQIDRAREAAPAPVAAARSQAKESFAAPEHARADKVSTADVLNRDWAPTLAGLQAPPAPMPQVSSHHQEMSVEVGGIYITEPGADAHKIQRAVADGIREALGGQTLNDLTQLSPAYG